MRADSAVARRDLSPEPLQIITEPLWKREFYSYQTTATTFLSAVQHQCWRFEDDLPLLLENQMGRLMISVTRIPHLNRQTAEREYLLDAIRIIQTLVPDLISSRVRMQDLRERSTICAVIGVDPGSSGHQFNEASLDKFRTRASIPQATQRLLERSGFNLQSDNLIPAILCVLNQSGGYLERAIKITLDDSTSSVTQLLNLARNMQQDQISIEHLRQEIISTYKLPRRRYSPFKSLCPV